MRSSRDFRCGKHSEQRENCCKSQVSAKTRFRPSESASSKACSKAANEGGAKAPSRARVSRAPLPRRVGISETAEAWQSNANPTERRDQASSSCFGWNGGKASTKVRREICSRCRKSTAAAKARDEIRLF